MNPSNVLILSFGGPWGSGTEELQSYISLLDPSILNNFIIVSFDPRDVGKSQNLNCQTPLSNEINDINVASGEGVEQLIQKNEEIGQACTLQYSGFENYLGTLNTAKDLDQIRLALGVKQISYLGYSYGSQLGSLYLMLYPQNVRAMVLDGNIPPERDLQLLAIEAGQAEVNTLSQFFKECDANSTCPIYPDAEAAYNQAVAKVTSTPIPTWPQGDNLPLTLAHFYIAVESMITNTGMSQQSLSPNTWGMFAQGIKEINQSNDASLLGYLYVQGTGYPNSDSSALSVYYAVYCSDMSNLPDNNTILQTAADMRQNMPGLGAFVGSTYLATCAGWPGQNQPLPDLTSYSNNVPPVLLVGNLNDPATPYIWSERLNQTIPNSTLITWAGAGHMPYLENEPPGTCVKDYVNNYLINLTGFLVEALYVMMCLIQQCF